MANRSVFTRMLGQAYSGLVEGRACLVSTGATGMPAVVDSNQALAVPVETELNRCLCEGRTQDMLIRATVREHTQAEGHSISR
jgi:hypothetical protein